MKNQYKSQQLVLSDLNKLVNRDFQKIAENPLAKENFRRYASLAHDKKTNEYCLLMPVESITKSNEFFVHYEWNSIHGKHCFDVIEQRGVNAEYNYIIVEEKNENGKARKAKLPRNPSLKIVCISIGKDAVGHRIATFQTI
jgi:hypothetical protein